jgi:hypothetical protein
MSFDLASILNDAQTGANQFADLATATFENTKAQTDITSLMTDQAKIAQRAAEDMYRSEAEVKQKTQQTNLKVAQTLGTDAGSAGWLIGDMGKRVIAADKEAQQALEVVRNKQSINFLDNPIGFLYGQATINSDIDVYNGAVRKADLAKDTAQKLESMSQASFVTQNAIEQSVTDASIKSGAILKGYEFGRQANLAQLEGLRTNLTGLQQAVKATAESIDMKFKGLAAVNQDRAYQVSLAHLQLSREQFNLAKAAKADALDQDTLVAKYISKGFFNLSGQPLDPVRAKEMVMLYKSGQPDIREMFSSGMQSYMISSDGKQSVISTSPYDAATSFGRGLVQNMPEAQKQVGEYLVEQRRAFANPAIQNKLQIDPKDKTAQERAFNEFIRTNATQAAANGTGIYAPTSLETVAKSNPNMANLAVWKTVLAPMAAAGVKLDDPNLVAGAVSKAVQAGTLSYNDALKLPTMYNAGIEINNMSRNWISTGMPIGTGYVAALSGAGLMGKIPVKMSDEMSWTAYLNKNLVRDTLTRRSNVMLPPGSPLGIDAFNYKN